MQKSIRLDRFLGIDNIHDTLPLNGKGITFSSGVNCYIDNEGKLHRRGAIKRLLSNNVHSLWSSGFALYGIVDNRLCFIQPTVGSYSIITSDYEFSFPTNFKSVYGRIYVSDKLTIGYIENDRFVITNTALREFKEHLPPGELLDSYKNRLYTVTDNTAYYSDPVALHRMDIRNNAIPFPAPIRVWHALTSGIWVASDQMYWVSGDSPNKFKFDIAHPDPAIRGTDREINAKQFGPDLIDNALMWRTANSVCLGTNDGRVVELTRKKYKPHVGYEGCAVVRTIPNHDQYISIVY